MTSFWENFTNIGDVGLTFPLIGLLTANLLYLRRWRAAVLVPGLFGAAMALVLVTKLAYEGWDIGISAIVFRGFSGHAAQGTAALPLLLMCIGNSEKWVHGRKIGLLVGLLLGCAIAVSRVELGLHSVSEVVSGWCLGAIVSMCFYRYKVDQCSRGWAVALLVLLLVIIGSGRYNAPLTIIWVWRWAAWLRHILS